MPEMVTFEDLEKIGISYTDLTLRQLEKAGKFPKRFKLGKNTRWVKSDVEKWVADKVAASRAA